MPHLSLSRRQWSLVSVVIVLAGIGVSGFANSASTQQSGRRSPQLTQDEIAAPANDEAMQKFMARKLAAAKDALEAVAKNDYDQIRKSASDMIELSRHEAWERMASPRFVQDTMDFVSSAEFLSRMAEARDSEGTALGFMRLTMTCTNCHQHVRSNAVAQLDDRLLAPVRTLAAAR